MKELVFKGASAPLNTNEIGHEEAPRCEAPGGMGEWDLRSGLGERDHDLVLGRPVHRDLAVRVDGRDDRGEPVAPLGTNVHDLGLREIGGIVETAVGDRLTGCQERLHVGTNLGVVVARATSLVQLPFQFTEVHLLGLVVVAGIGSA